MTAAYGGRAAWIVPAFRNGYPLWRWLEQTLADVKQSNAVVMNRSNRTVEFANGGFLGLYSASDDADSVRGDAFDLAVIDEASRVSEVAYTDSIQPSLADRGGRALLISTPAGRNWFYREWLVGQRDDQDYVRSFQAPSTANPMPQIQKAASMARERVSDRTFRQEWLAEFVDDAGGVFHHPRSCVKGQLQTTATLPHQYIIGLDVAKYNDYTVAIVVDTVDRHVVAFERFHQEDYILQMRRILKMVNTWNNAIVWMDSTGVGDPIYDMLAREHIRINGYKFTNSSKKELIENAVLMIENRAISYPNIPILIDELEAYQYERSPSGMLKMNAPSGMHDDCVIALALALWPLATPHRSIGALAMEELFTTYSELNTKNLMNRIF